MGKHTKGLYSCMLCIKAWLPVHELRMDGNENPGFRFSTSSYLTMPSGNCHSACLCWNFYSLGTKKPILIFRGQIHTSLQSAASSREDVEGQALISLWPVRQPTWMTLIWVRQDLIWILRKGSSLLGVIGCWDWLPREVVTEPSLAELTKHLDNADPGGSFPSQHVIRFHSVVLWELSEYMCLATMK